MSRLPTSRTDIAMHLDFSSPRRATRHIAAVPEILYENHPAVQTQRALIEGSGYTGTAALEQLSNYMHRMQDQYGGELPTVLDMMAYRNNLPGC